MQKPSERCCEKCEPEWMHDGHSHSDEWIGHQSFNCMNKNCPCHEQAAKKDLSSEHIEKK